MTSKSRSGVAFARRRLVSGVTSAGVFAALTLVVVSPAAAATAGDCTLANTVSPTSLPSPTVALQTLLTAAKPIICIKGTIVLSSGLVTGGSVSLLGLDDAVLDGANAYRILRATAVVHDITAESIRFTGGRANEGAAIQGRNVRLVNTTFDHNVATGAGGAVDANTVDVVGSIFEDNSAGGYGGGAIWFDSTAAVASSQFRRNTTTDRGGALASYGVITSITGSTFEDNTAVSAGGAIFANTAATISGSTFARNSATYGFGTAGAVITGTLVVTNSTFVGNTAGNWAGAVFAGYGTIAQSTFRDNHATSGQAVWGHGGAISTYAGNIFAGTGQQVVDYDGLQAGDLGGNVFTTDASAEQNFPSTGSSTIFGQSIASIFGTEVLGDNGGPVPTLALPAGSVAINIVPYGSPVTTDARTWARVAANDAGAFEFGAIDPSPPAVPVAAALAATGSDSWQLAALAAGLVALGALALAPVRRRRRV